jgi:hypothetical protein
MKIYPLSRETPTRSLATLATTLPTLARGRDEVTPIPTIPMLNRDTL